MTQQHLPNQVHLQSLDLATRASRQTPTIPRINADDVTTLMRHCLRIPSFFSEARELITPHNFLPQEAEVVAIWHAMCARSPQPFTVEGLVSCIREYIQSARDCILRPDQHHRLTSLDGSGVIPEWLATPQTHLDIDRARALLQRFLIERRVMLPMMHYLGQVAAGSEFIPSDLPQFLEHAKDEITRINGSLTPRLRTLGDTWDDHEQRLNVTRGRQFVGLSTGFPELDAKTLGLRGLIVLGAMPSVGKTALCGQLAMQVCQQHEVNDAAVLFLSLEMAADDLRTRAKCMLSGLDWQTYVRGSQEYRGTDNDTFFTPEHLSQIENSRNLAISSQIGQRLCFADRADVGVDLTAPMINGLVSQLKSRAGANRALVVVDYLQLLGVPGDVSSKGDLETDKHRIRILQDVVEGSKTESNPLGDAVIVISEARKPSGTQESRRRNIWGQGLAELMGSARLGYAADAVLLYRRMNDEDIKQHYNAQDASGVARQTEILERRGVSPVILTLEKGRDGMTRGEIPMEFDYRRSCFSELNRGRPGSVPAPMFRRQRPTIGSPDASEVAQT